MKKWRLLSLFVMLFCSVAVNAEKPEVLDSVITDVTLYSDRARVKRHAKVKLASGIKTYSFTKLPGWVDRKSVRLGLIGADGKIIDVQVSRQYLAESDNAEIKDARASVQELTDKAAELRDELSVLDAEKQQIEQTRVFAMEKLPKDAALKDIGIEGYSEVVGFISEALLKNAARRREIEKVKRELEPDIRARTRKLKDLEQLTRLEESTVTVSIESSKEVNAGLTLTYMLPGATWEPVHELRVNGDAATSAELTSYAVVTQTTGEDWTNAKLAFSTQSPREVMQIPELKALLLDNNGASAVNAHMPQISSFKQAEEAYQAQQMGWNMYLGNSVNILEPNWRQQNRVSSRIKSIFETLSKRGTTAHFVGMTRPIIRTDGQPVRVQMGAAYLKTKLNVVAAPQASLNAVNTLKMTNSGAQPFLPGNVHLYKNGAFIGMTEIGFVAEGEPFAVFLGVEDKVKISRVPDMDFCSIDRGKRTRMKVAFDLTVENLSDQVVDIDVTDQVPVSEDRDIDVDKVDIEPDIEPDSKGLVKWRVNLKAKEKKSMRIEYRVEYEPAVIHARMERKMQSKGAAIQMPAESANNDLLIDLEESLF